MAKTYTKTLSSGNDRLVLIAEAIKSGASVYAFHIIRDGKKVVSKTRGGSEKFETMAEGQAAVDKAVTAAIASGWAEPTKRGGPAQPDTFTLTALPTPRKAEAGTPPAPKAPETPSQKLVGDALNALAGKPTKPMTAKPANQPSAGK